MPSPLTSAFTLNVAQGKRARDACTLTLAFTHNVVHGWGKKCQVHSHRLLRTMQHRAEDKAKCIHTGFYAQCNTGLMKQTKEEIHINLYTVMKTGVPVFPCIPDEGYGISLHDGWRIKKKHCIHTVIYNPWIAD